MYVCVTVCVCVCVCVRACAHLRVCAPVCAANSKRADIYYLKPSITAADATVNEYMLTRVWQEIHYHLDDLRCKHPATVNWCNNLLLSRVRYG